MKRRKILFVCSGNTGRSPMAESILRSKIKARKIKWWDVSSCGLFAEVGGTLSAGSAEALAGIGLSLTNFSPRQLSQKLIDRSYAVICMTERQKQVIEACGKIYSIKELCGFDVPDPYGCGAEVYRATRDAISRACDVIIEKIIVAADSGDDL